MQNEYCKRLFSNLILIGILFCLPTGLVYAQESTPQPDSGRVKGRVRNLTAGAVVPAGIPVSVYLLENFEPVKVMTSTLDNSGVFTLSNVVLNKEWVYIATVDYQNVAYGSSFVSLDGEEEVIQLDIDLYESTTEPSNIRINRLHIIIEFTENSLIVSELYIFDNLGDRVYVGPSGRPESGTLELPIPDGAVNPGVERNMGDSMISASNTVIAGQDVFLDTLAARPGESIQQLMLSYDIPYQDNAIISHPLPYPVESVTLLLPDAGLEVRSDQLKDSGSIADGMPFVRWDGDSLQAGQVLSFQIVGELEGSQFTGAMTSRNDSGGNKVGFPFSVSVGDNATTLLTGIGSLVVTLGLVAYLFVKDRNIVQQNSRRDFLQAIVDLDKAFENRKIPAGTYQLERERLKTELRRWYSIQAGLPGKSEQGDNPGNG